MTESKEASRPQLVVPPEQAIVAEQGNNDVVDNQGGSLQPRFSFGMSHVVIFGIKIKTVLFAAFIIIVGLILAYVYKNLKEKRAIQNRDNQNGDDDDDSDDQENQPNQPNQQNPQNPNQTPISGDDMTKHLQTTIEHQAAQIHNLQQKIQRHNQIMEEQINKKNMDTTNHKQNYDIT